MKRALILLLIVALLTPSLLCQSVYADDVPETAAEEPIEEPAEAPAEEPAGEPAGKAAPYAAASLEQALSDAESGNVDAMVWLGNMYARGKAQLAISRDFEQALSWYRKAADAGCQDPEALYTLANMYERGTGTAKDRGEAYVWYKAAAAAGSEAAKEAVSNARFDSLRWKDDSVEITGVIGENMNVAGHYAYPVYLDKPVEDCSMIAMELSIVEYTGWPFGAYSLYALDQDGEWQRLDHFKLDKSMQDGSVKNFVFSIKEPFTIRALALCISEKGMEFTVKLKPVFYALEDQISEYGGALKAPAFVPADVEYPVVSAAVGTQAYYNPYDGWSP